MNPVKIVINSIPNCPSAEAASSLVRKVAESLSTPAEVWYRSIWSQEEAERERFLGSPTIKIDGNDTCWDAMYENGWCYGSRVYMDAGKAARLPSERDVRDGILLAQALRFRRCGNRSAL